MCVWNVWTDDKILFGSYFRWAMIEFDRLSSPWGPSTWFSDLCHRVTYFLGTMLEFIWFFKTAGGHSISLGLCPTKLPVKWIPVCIRGEDLDPPYPSHKTLGPNLSLYKEVSPVKIWSLQKARVNLGQGAKNRHKSDLQEGGPTLMAKLSEPSIIHLVRCFPILLVEDSVLSGGWVPSNLEHFVETEAFSVQVYKKLIDILHDWENCSKMTSLQKAMHSTWWFLELICLQVLGYQAHIAVQNSYLFQLHTGPKPPQNVEEIQTGIEMGYPVWPTGRTCDSISGLLKWRGAKLRTPGQS